VFVAKEIIKTKRIKIFQPNQVKLVPYSELISSVSSLYYMCTLCFLTAQASKDSSMGWTKQIMTTLGKAVSIVFNYVYIDG